jgi:RHS repeat-associated protein
VASVTDVRNTTTSYAYDESNRQTAVMTGVTPVDNGTASGGSTTTLQDSAKSWTSSLVGKTVVITAGLGAGQTAIISAVNSPTQVTFQTALLTGLGSGSVYQIVSGGRSRSTAYDAAGNVTAVQDGVGNTTQYLYDNANRRTGTIDALSNRTTQVLDGSGAVTKFIDALINTTTMVLDALHRTIGRIDPRGHQTTQVLDAVDAGVGSIDALGNVSQVVTDALGRVMASVDALGALTRTLYDGHGNVAQRVDPDGNLWQYSYDRLNRETVRTDPLGAAVTTSYDDAGRVTQVVDRDNRTQKFSYDSADRVTAATWLSGTTTVNLLTYSYDNAGNLLTAKDTNGTITNTYDALGRMSSTTDVFGLTLTYSYDNADRRTLRQDSKNGVLTSVYDSGNRVTTMMFGGSGQTQARVDLTYSTRNELTGVTRYGDIGAGTLAGTTSYSYDDASRVTAITHKNSAGATLSYYNTSFDNADRVTQESWGSGASSGTHTYAYDTTSQLTQDGTTGYAYYGNGNRTTAGTLTYQPAVNNRVTNDGVYTYGYDAESNLTSKTKIGGGDTWTYGYDLRNRLTSVVETGGSTFTATYTYDVLGRRILEDRTDNSGNHTTTRFSYDGNQVWAELSTSNVVQARYLYGDGEAQVLERTDGSGNVQWFLTDRLGNVRDIATSTVVSNHVEYQAFGAIASESTPGTGEAKLYTGLYLDRATGIVFADARTLLVTTGQWMQEDPIWFQAGDANLRRYVRNNPTNATDPSGLWTLIDHQILTDRALSAAASALSIPPQDLAIIHRYIMEGNFSQDRDNLFRDERHFTRPQDAQTRAAENDAEFGVERARSTRRINGAVWDIKYEEYLRSEEKTFFGLSSQRNVGGSLMSLGRLTHSWQDFFAHAIRIDQGGNSLGNLEPGPRFAHHKSEASNWPGWVAWTDTEKQFSKATPEAHPGLMPSGYDTGFRADPEHPKFDEPLIAGGKEYNARYNAALAYTTKKLETLLSGWYKEHGASLRMINPDALPNPGLIWASGETWAAWRWFGDARMDRDFPPASARGRPE